MSGTKGGRDGADGAGPGAHNVADALASIRKLVSAEADARRGPGDAAGAGVPVPVLMLTPQMRVGAAAAGEVLAEGIAEAGGRGAPILDEEALRGVVNAIVREELQGEMGDRISRNLRKLVRREIALVLREEREERAAAEAPEA